MDQSKGEHNRPSVQRRTAVRFAGFELHPGRQLLCDGVPVSLGKIAIDLLGALVHARGRLVTKDELFEAAWSGVVVVDNALHQHMRALRKTLGNQAGLVVTVARRGYRFVGHCEEVCIESADAFEADQAPLLPAPLTPLIGRAVELQTIERLLGERRCVTLLGPGGVGKTRLAIEVARRWADRGAKVHWVELASIADGASVDGAIATAFGLAGPSSLPPLARVRRGVGEKAALLILDNCEHLVEACAAAAHELLQGSPGLKIMATSQHPLGISGEHRARVSMLGLPPAGCSDPDVLAASPAVQLLLVRVGDCDSQLSLGADALQDAAELCRLLDGNALAIELAAARVAAVGLAVTRGALANHLSLLAGGPRDGLPKHRSLDAMIEWSHALLSGEQAAAFRRLAVFAGGWTIESAMAVVGAGQHDGIDIASRLAELVERSMLVAEGSARSPRLRMLEAQRIYALEKLRACGEYERYAAAHARHFAARFEAAYSEWDRTPDATWIACYGPELDNLRAAMRTAAAACDGVLCASLVGSSIWLWRAIGAMHELRQLLRHPLLRSSSNHTGVAWARLKLAQAYALHATSSESSSVKSASSDAVEAFEVEQDVIGAANAVLCLASAYAQLGDTASHKACLGRVAVLLRGHRQGKTYGWYCGSHAWAAQLAGNVRAALGWAKRSRTAYRDGGSRHGETRAMLHLADLHLAAGDIGQSIAFGQECVVRLQGGLHRDDLGRALANLGAAWFAGGEPEQARGCWARALDELRGLDFSYWVFDHIALLAIAEGRDDAAARMLGYAEAGYARLQKGRRVQNEQGARDRAVAILRSRFRATELAALLSAGADASEQQVMALALALRPGVAQTS